MIIALLLSGGLALTGQAQTPTTGRQVALGLESACADKTDTLFARAADGATVTGRWITIAGPTFDLAPSDPRPGLTAHAVDPVDPRRLLVSEGETIQLSEDGGCSWKKRHFEPSTYGEIDLGEIGVVDRIRQLEFAGQGRDRRAYALMSPNENQAGAVRVLVSDNAGADWEDRSVGLPPLYTRYDSSVLVCESGPCPTAVLATAPSDPDVAYLSLTDGVTPSLFRTRNGGRSWERLSLTTIGSEVAEMAVAPDDPNDLWVIFTAQLARSRDGGDSWEFPDGAGGGPRGVAGLHLSSGERPTQIQVLVFDKTVQNPPHYAVLRSADNGATFNEIKLDVDLQGVPAPAPGGAADDLVLATDRPDGARQFDPAAREFTDITTRGLGEVAAPRRDSTTDPVHWFRQYAGLAAFVPGPLPGLGPREKLPFAPFDAVPVAPGRIPGALLPAELDIELGREGSQVVDYRLDLPALPTPVDIWFLIDTSGSMRGAIDGLRQGFETIIKELSASGLDAWFGLATFPAQRLLYERQADVAPPGPELYEALQRLNTDGQNNEIHATALYQSVTGAGQVDEGIKPGRGATFRPHALKIIVHATDEAYGTTSTGPTIDEAAEALAAAGVRHVGLDLAAGAPDPGASFNGIRSTKTDHDTLALATNTLTPKGGLDCNGDGLKELEEGDPITCPILRGRDRLEITPAIISAVRAVRDETAVALTVVDAGGIGVEIDEPVRSPVDLKRRNSLPFAVRYTCPAEMTGKVATVVLRATVRGAPSAEGVARIGCGVAIPAAPAPSPRPQPPAAVAPVIAAPPQLVPDLEPGLTPLNQPAPAQVAQPSPQPGVATQPGQAATAKQRAGRDGPAPPSADTGESRDQSTSPATTGTLAAGAGLSLALGGWAVGRQRRQESAVARA